MIFWQPDIDPQTEPRRVLIKRGVWHDEARDRNVPYKIYYPEETDLDPLPVIIWSHGLGGTADGAGFLARYLASRGYIHVNIQHDGTDDSLWRGKEGHPWDNIRKSNITWETVKNRYLDAPYAVDQLRVINDQDDILKNRLDLDNIGMSGHSFGAVTTQIMSGQMTGKETLEDLYDDRFKAAIAYSPVPNTRLKLPPEQVYSGIKTPLLHMTGTEDHSPLDGDIQTLRDEIYHYAGQNGAMQMSVIIGGADHMVFNGSRGQLPDYDGLETHKENIKILALAWWSYFLNSNQSAMEWLKSQAEGYLPDHSTLTFKGE